MTSWLPNNEEARLAVLRAYDVLDTEPEPFFDDITQIAAQICEVPIALVSLVDETRQWFKSRIGLNFSETPREMSFCTHAIQEKSIMEVPMPTSALPITLLSLQIR